MRGAQEQSQLEVCSHDGSVACGWGQARGSVRGHHVRRYSNGHGTMDATKRREVSCFSARRAGNMGSTYSHPPAVGQCDKWYVRRGALGHVGVKRGDDRIIARHDVTHKHGHVHRRRKDGAREVRRRDGSSGGAGCTTGMENACCNKQVVDTARNGLPLCHGPRCVMRGMQEPSQLDVCSHDSSVTLRLVSDQARGCVRCPHGLHDSGGHSSRDTTHRREVQDPVAHADRAHRHKPGCGCASHVWNNDRQRRGNRRRSAIHSVRRRAQRHKHTVCAALPRHCVKRAHAWRPRNNAGNEEAVSCLPLAAANRSGRGMHGATSVGIQIRSDAYIHDSVSRPHWVCRHENVNERADGQIDAHPANLWDVDLDPNANVGAAGSGEQPKRDAERTASRVGEHSLCQWQHLETRAALLQGNERKRSQCVAGKAAIPCEEAVASCGWQSSQWEQGAPVSVGCRGYSRDGARLVHGREQLPAARMPPNRNQIGQGDGFSVIAVKQVRTCVVHCGDRHKGCDARLTAPSPLCKLPQVAVVPATLLRHPK